MINHSTLAIPSEEPAFTTFTVFRYAPSARPWAFTQMGLALKDLSKVPGLTFFQLMGSGRGLVFSRVPDWSRYMLLATWKSESHYKAFCKESSPMISFREKAIEIWTVKMYPIKSQGLWAGINPFHPSLQSIPENAPVAILTRASIRLRSLWQFWQNAPKAAQALEQTNGLIFSCGMGELPFVRQATLSIWENLSAMKNFAYGSLQHTQVMKRKVEQDWYWEELFARFIIVGTEGSYFGANPLSMLPFPSYFSPESQS